MIGSNVVRLDDLAPGASAKVELSVGGSALGIALSDELFGQSGTASATTRSASVRRAMIDQPPMLFPFTETVVLRTRTERFLPAKGTKLPDAARILGYDDMGALLIDMAVADELTGR